MSVRDVILHTFKKYNLVLIFLFVNPQVIVVIIIIVSGFIKMH